MSELTDSLRAHGQRHMGTDLGGLLQWAALHIDAQDEALKCGPIPKPGRQHRTE